MKCEETFLNIELVSTSAGSTGAECTSGAPLAVPVTVESETESGPESDSDNHNHHDLHRQQHLPPLRPLRPIRPPSRSLTYTELGDLQASLTSPGQFVNVDSPTRHAVIALTDSYKLVSFMRVLLFELMLISGYVMYRLLACGPLAWECEHKSYQQQYDDITSLCAIGGVIFATGVTVPKANESVWLYLMSLMAFVSGLLGIGGLGELDFMKNSLVSESAWRFPAVLLYALVVLAILGTVIYSIYSSPSGYERIVTVMILISLAVVYSSAPIFAIVAGVTGSDIPFHPHHYQIAWHMTMLIRARYPTLCVVVRWIFIGIFVQGLSAYSAGSMLQ